MFTLELGDYKYIFEYDTKEELDEYLKLTMATHEQAVAIKNRHAQAHKLIEKEEKYPKEISISWSDLEIKFVASRKKMGKVSERSYRAYETTFNKLKEFFGRKRLIDLTIEDYEAFRDHLKEIDQLKSKTINNHLAYVNKFLDFAVTYKIIPENTSKGLESYKEDDSIPKENFTDQEIKAIFEYDFPQAYKDIFTLAAYTGMRVAEITRLTPESIMIDKESGAYYFSIGKAKTKAGIRKVPIHKDIVDAVVDRMRFPLLDEKSENASQKAILRQLYKVIPQTGIKTFHTFRGTFIQKCLENYPRDLLVIQEIVGHKKTEGSLTIDDYAKGFPFALKKEIVDSVTYSLS